MTANPRNHNLPMLLLVVLACASLGGCGPGREMYPGSNTSRVTAVSRVVLPLNGGQTIYPPQKMADVTTLWAPLTAKEKQHLATIRVFPVQLQTGHVVLDGWLPPSEKQTMQEYYYRLHTSSSDAMTRTLQRAHAYLPSIRETLRQHGIPEALAYLPMVESAYEPQAVSPAGAVGLWQLMPATARRFGLTVNDKLDERLDPVKSTQAAAAYLRWLYSYFNDWPLAVTAYNCGEGAMQKALTSAKASTLTELVHVCRLQHNKGQSGSRPQGGLGWGLGEESLNFLPRLVAAANFFKEQERNPVSMTKTTAVTGTITKPADHAVESRATINAGNGHMTSSPRNPGQTEDAKLKPSHRERSSYKNGLNKHLSDRGGTHDNTSASHPSGKQRPVQRTAEQDRYGRRVSQIPARQPGKAETTPRISPVPAMKRLT